MKQPTAALLFCYAQLENRSASTIETLKKNIKTFKKYMNKNYKKEYMFKAFEFFFIFQKDKT